MTLLLIWLAVSVAFSLLVAQFIDTGPAVVFDQARTKDTVGRLDAECQPVVESEGVTE